jgi:hypothetical protein
MTRAWITAIVLGAVVFYVTAWRRFDGRRRVHPKKREPIKNADRLSGSVKRVA